MKAFKKLVLKFTGKFGTILALSNLMVGEGYLKNLQVTVITVFVLSVVDLLKYVKAKYLRFKLREQFNYNSDITVRSDAAAMEMTEPVHG